MCSVGRALQMRSYWSIAVVLACTRLDCICLRCAQSSRAASLGSRKPASGSWRFFIYIKTKKEERGQRHIRSKPPPQRKQPMSREDAGTYASDSFNAPHKAAMCACLNSIEWPLLVIATIIFFVQISFNQHLKLTSIKFKQKNRTSDDT